MTTQQEAAGTTAQSPFGWRFVTPMFMGSALNPVNSSLIATALVPIAAAMGVSVGRTAVLVSALYLASSIAQPTAGEDGRGVRAARGVPGGHPARARRRARRRVRH